MPQKYSISRRQARRITVDAYKFISFDIEESDLDRKRDDFKISMFTRECHALSNKGKAIFCSCYKCEGIDEAYWA